MVGLFWRVLIAAAAASWMPLGALLFAPGPVPWFFAVALAVLFLWVNLRPIPADAAPTKQIRRMAGGTALLRVFCWSTAVSTAVTVAYLCFLAPWACVDGFAKGLAWLIWWMHLLSVVVVEAILFWNGMLRVYLSSVQLGIRHRVLAALCGWVPILNLWYLAKIIRITTAEAELETEKWELDEIRAESAVCQTKYPILLVHGVFFRDFRYLNYWGRIPQALKRNGAQLYYGQQQSAASVRDSGKELADRIRQIVQETGCEKVNIIAHSKGGLDSRAAISLCGAAPWVATLTTVNTPHRGCLFAEYLLNKISAPAREKIAKTYNAAMKKLGDNDPDFLAAVTDLTASACKAFNEAAPDDPGVYYESIMSYCKKAAHGKFPLNMTQPVVKHFDGQNDGLVSVDSARWGQRFTLLEPSSRRGISHGDVIDLNRENIPGFDVREFYVGLVSRLKDLGF